MSTGKSKSKARPPREDIAVVPITQNRVKPGEYLRNIFCATVPPNVGLEDISQGRYWANIAKTLHVTDRIEVVDETGQFFTELFVTSVNGPLVRVKVLRHVRLVEDEDTEPLDDESDLEVKHRGQIKKHCVQVKETKEIIKEGFDTAAEAKQYLLSYETGLTN